MTTSDSTPTHPCGKLCMGSILVDIHATTPSHAAPPAHTQPVVPLPVPRPAVPRCARSSRGPWSRLSPRPVVPLRTTPCSSGVARARPAVPVGPAAGGASRSMWLSAGHAEATSQKSTRATRRGSRAVRRGSGTRWVSVLAHLHRPPFPMYGSQEE